MQKKTEAGQMSRGVYFLSNDAMLELTIACLNSFRKYNPDIPVCIIPFNSNMEKISKLKDVYNMEIFEDQDLLKKCDDISVKFHGVVNGSYRKLAMWEGMFDEFVYIDVDTIVIESIDFVFPILPDFGCITSHSNMPSIRKFVWKDTIYETGHLSTEQIEFAANTGFIASKNKFMSFEWISNQVEAALSVKEHMELFCQEQPLLNYLIITKGEPFSSLLVIRDKYKNVKVESWGGRTGGIIKNGKIRFKEGAPIFLVHWAGIWRPNRWDWAAFKFLNYLGLSNKEPQINSRLPNKRLWKYYRNLKMTYAADRLN